MENRHVQETLKKNFCLCLQILDGRIYEQVKDYLVSLCQTELETYEAVHNTFSQLLNSSNEVSLQNLLDLQ